MTFTIFRRHNRETCDSRNRYDPRCGCPLHVQFVWKNGDAVFEEADGFMETEFYLPETFPAQESAIEAGIQAGRQKIDAGFERGSAVVNG